MDYQRRCRELKFAVLEARKTLNTISEATDKRPSLQKTVAKSVLRTANMRYFKFKKEGKKLCQL